MSSFHRQNLYSGATDDETVDFSGFLGDLPPTQASLVYAVDLSSALYLPSFVLARLAFSLA